MRILRITALLVAIAALTAYFTACGGSSEQRSSSATFIMETDLIAGAGQGWPATGTDIGTVTVERDGSNLLVTLACDITGDPGTQHYLSECHLDIGTTLAAFKNGVSFGLFPWTATGLPANTTTYTFTLPITGSYPNGGKNAYRKGSYDFSGAALSQLFVTAHASAGHLEGYEPPTQIIEVVCDRMPGALGSYPVYVGDAESSYVAGTLDVSLAANDLTFEFTPNDNCIQLDRSALQIQSASPINWGPDDWMFDNAPGQTEYTLSLATLDIPDCADDCGGNPYTLYFGYYVEVTNTCDGALSGNGSAFSTDCADNFIVGQPGECHLEFVDSDLNINGVVTLRFDSNGNDRGYAELSLDENGDLVVKITSTNCGLDHAQMYVGTGIPSFSPGDWYFKIENLGGACSATFPPVDLDQFGTACGQGCVGSGLDHLNFALHMTENTESSMATGCNPRSFPGHDGHWKKWDDCVLTFECVSDEFFRFCSFDVPACEERSIIIDVPGNPGTWVGDTAMGFDNSVTGESDGVSRNEPGWFPTMYPTVTRWGWTFRSPRP